MATTFTHRLASDTVFSEKMDNINALLAAIASENDEPITLSSFKDLQTITRMGLASKYLSVGDQIVSERASTMSATVGNSQGNTGITAASVVRDTFLHTIGTAHNGDYEFKWDGASWHYNDEAVELSTYGITVTGTPVLGDEVIIHETAASLVWDVIGIDQETPRNPDLKHSVTLQLHDCFASLTFHEREAFIAFPDGLAAGTYNFTVTTHPWASTNNGKTFQFTTTQAIAAKGQLVLQAGYNASLSGSSIKTYSSPSATTVLETLTLTEGSGGTSLGSANSQINGNINSLQRSLLGNNNYNQSYVRQYINSTAAAGGVWSAQNKWDRVPSWNGTTAGFLNGMDDDFLSVVGEVEKTTALNTVSDGGGSTKTYEKFFLLSRSEIYGNKESNINEGSPYDYYKNYSDYSAPNDGADTNRIKYRNNAAQYWWLRSPYVPNAYIVRYVNTLGTVDINGANHSNGVAPACAII